MYLNNKVNTIHNMKKLLMAGCLALILVIAGCIQQPQTNSIKITLTDKIGESAGFAIFNTSSKDYRAFEFNDKGVRLYISFKPDLINNYSTESFNKNFNYANVQIGFPEKSTIFTEAYFQNREPVRQIKFLSYDGKKLSGQLGFAVDHITFKTSDPNCVSDDIIGYCYEDKKADLNYLIDFDLTVPK